MIRQKGFEKNPPISYYVLENFLKMVATILQTHLDFWKIASFLPVLSQTIRLLSALFKSLSVCFLLQTSGLPILTVHCSQGKSHLLWKGSPPLEPHALQLRLRRHLFPAQLTILKEHNLQFPNNKQKTCVIGHISQQAKMKR